MRFFYTFIFSLLGCFVFSQGEWLTDYEEAVKTAKYNDKKILLELGEIVNEFALFISDEEWNNDSVQYYMYNYVPTSILLESNDPLIYKFDVDYTPTILIISENGNILFKQSGTMVSEQITALLKFVHFETETIDFLMTTYRKDDSPIGYLRKTEELLYLTTIAPEICKDYFLGFAEHNLAKLSKKSSQLDTSFLERFKILSTVFDYINWQDAPSIEKLNKYSDQNVASMNQAVLAYYKYYLLNSLGNFDQAINIARDLENKSNTLNQAKAYTKRIKKLALSPYK